MSEIYLDHAATTAMHPEVLDAMLPYYTKEYYNPSTGYQAGRDVKKKIEDTREYIASCIHAFPDEIYYTSGGTEGDNWIMNSVCRPRLMRASGNETAEKEGAEYTKLPHIITSQIEHHAILNTCKELEAMGGQVSYLPVDAHGRIRLSELITELQPDTGLVSIQFANNEIGTIQPVTEIGSLCREYGIPFHTDAVQACCHIPIDVQGMHIHSLSASAHKFQGPKGVGFLYVRRSFPLTSYVQGGGQERGYRAGTENVPGIIGMGKAMELAYRNMEIRLQEEQQKRDYFIRRILYEIPDTRVNGHMLYRLPNNINLSFRYVNGPALLVLLDNDEIYVSSGSACNSNHSGPSHVISALHMPEDYENGVLRITIGEENTIEELETVVQLLKRYVTELRAEAPELAD